MIFKNIRYVLNALLKDIKKIWFVSTLIAEISFILLYAYSIYSNINELFFLIIYSVLFVVSLSAFILHWVLSDGDLPLEIKEKNPQVEFIVAD